MVLAVCGLAVLVFAGSARATVVQAHEPDDYLIGQRWAAPATGPQTLTVVAQRNVDWTTVTLLDFDSVARRPSLTSGPSGRDDG